jgi:hypothetical protein
MYQLFCSRSDSARYLLCREGEFERLPEAVRLRGPWDIKRRDQLHEFAGKTVKHCRSRIFRQSSENN